MSTVLAVLYLIFNEGYLSTTAASVRDNLCAEAIRLTRHLREASAPLGPQLEVVGLLALMLLLDARRPARMRDGVLVALPDQDRSAWNSDQIEEGHMLVRQCLALKLPWLLPDRGLGPTWSTRMRVMRRRPTCRRRLGLDDQAAVPAAHRHDRRRASTVRVEPAAEHDGAQVALAILHRPTLAPTMLSTPPRADLLPLLCWYSGGPGCRISRPSH